MVGLRSPLSSSLSLQTQKNSRRLRRQRVLVLCWFFATVLFINAFVPKQSSIRNESQLHSHGKNVLTADAILASLSSFNHVFGGRGRGRASSNNNNNNNDEFLRLQMEKERASGTLKYKMEREQNKNLMHSSGQSLSELTHNDNADENNFMNNNNGEDVGTLARPRIIPKTLRDTLIHDVEAREYRKFKKCSVIGNDSSMRNAKLGVEIERAQAIYRMNFAPLKMFEVDVGANTHTMCVNPEKMRRGLRKELSDMEKKMDGIGGYRSSSSSSSFSGGGGTSHGRWVTDNGNIPERVLVVGDVPGKDAKTGDSEKPCIERSQGGLCIERTKDKKIRNMKPSVQKLAEELLYTLQEGVGEENGVPTTGLYCLVLALTECESVDVYGIGVGTMNKEDMKDLEYFKDDHFRGWDARHNAEAERTLLRVLASKVWRNALMKPLGELKWHNPLMSSELVNANLLSQTACISGIRCV